MDEVESFVLNIDNARSSIGGRVNGTLYLLFDSQGLEDKTCIIAQRRYDGEIDKHIDAFDKVWAPWDDINLMWTNLDIGNMNFDEWCVDRGCDKDFWWRWKGIELLEMDKDKRATKEEDIKKFEEEGNV